GHRVRWEGETPLQPLLWRILEYLLSRGNHPIPVDDLCEEVWRDKPSASKTVTNALSRLNAALLLVRFPWEWSVSSGHIHRYGYLGQNPAPRGTCAGRHLVGSGVSPRRPEPCSATPIPRYYPILTAYAPASQSWRASRHCCAGCCAPWCAASP